MYRLKEDDFRNPILRKKSAQLTTIMLLNYHMTVKFFLEPHFHFPQTFCLKKQQ